MIASEHTLIRTADPDDAGFLLEVYRTERPKAALLDGRREPVLPNRDELAEMLIWIANVHIKDVRPAADRGGTATFALPGEGAALSALFGGKRGV